MRRWLHQTLMRWIRWYADRQGLVVEVKGLTLYKMMDRPVVNDAIYLSEKEYDEYWQLIGSVVEPRPDELYYRGHRVKPSKSIKELISALGGDKNED